MRGIQRRISRSHRHLLFRPLPEALHIERVAAKALAGRREPGSGVAAREQGPAKLLLQYPNPCAHRGLCDVQVLGGSVEIPRRSDFQKGLDLIDVHAAAPARTHMDGNRRLR
jgi:hypothetical protein